MDPAVARRLASRCEYGRTLRTALEEIEIRTGRAVAMAMVTTVVLLVVLVRMWGLPV